MAFNNASINPSPRAARSRPFRFHRANWHAHMPPTSPTRCPPSRNQNCEPQSNLRRSYNAVTHKLATSPRWAAPSAHGTTCILHPTCAIVHARTRDTPVRHPRPPVTSRPLDLIPLVVLYLGSLYIQYVHTAPNTCPSAHPCTRRAPPGTLVHLLPRGHWNTIPLVGLYLGSLRNQPVHSPWALRHTRHTLRHVMTHDNEGSP